MTFFFYRMDFPWIYAVFFFIAHHFSDFLPPGDVIFHVLF